MSSFFKSNLYSIIMYCIGFVFVIKNITYNLIDLRLIDQQYFYNDSEKKVVNLINLMNLCT